MSKSEEAPDRRARDADGLHRRRGIWYYTLNINGERRFFSTKTRSFQEARKVRANAIKAQLENRLPTDLAKLPFEILLGRVLEDRKPHLAEGTIRLERERSVPLLEHFSRRRISEIDATVIRNYQAARVKRVGPRTVNLETKVLRQVLKAAKTWGTISDDYKPLPEDRRGPGRALEESQEKLLFDTARSRPEWGAAFYAAIAAANTTMRGVELKNLRLANVNLVDREVIIRKSKGRTAGERRIPLNDAALWAFARLLERAHALGAMEPDHFLFPAFLYRQTKAATRGTGYDPTRHQKTWRSAWRSLIKETIRRSGDAAAFERLRFHDLRHTAITKLAEGEASDSTIMAISGHMDRSMLEHYSHIRAAAKRKAVEGIRSYIPEEIPAPTTKSVQ